MATANLNAFESIPEEHVADTRGLSETRASGVPVGHAETEPDKYENTTDPTVLRKARAVAKANHTRAIRAINEANLNDCPPETLERLRSHLSRTFDIVTKRHSRLLEFMLSPDESELEDEQAWLQRVHVDHQTILHVIDNVLVPRQSPESVSSRHEQVLVSDATFRPMEQPVYVTSQVHSAPPKAYTAPPVVTEEPPNSFTPAISQVTPPRSLLADSQQGPLQGIFRQMRGLASRTWEAITPRRVPPATRSNLFAPSRVFAQQTLQMPQPQPFNRAPAVQYASSSGLHQPLRRRLEESMSGIAPVNAVSTIVGTQPAGPPVNESASATQLRNIPLSQAAPPTAPPLRPSSVVTGVAPNPFTNVAINANYSPDAWIFEPDGAAYASILKPPKLQLMKFDGSPLSWPLFIQTFKVQVHDAVRSDAERIAHLGNCLPEHVRSQLGHLIIQPGLYRYALAELQRLYGSRQVIIKSCTAALESLKPFGNNDYQGLSKLASALRSVVATLQLCGFEAELNSYSNIELILRKVSPRLQEKWASAVWDLPELPSLVDLSDFLFETSMIEYTRRLGTAGSTERSLQPANRHSKPQRSQTAATGAATFAVAVSASCELCKANHHVSDCRQFKNANLERRCDIVREKSLCLRCLASGHRGQNCNSAQKCGKDGCERLHHRLLHGAPRLYPSRSASDADNQSPTTSFAGAIKRQNRGTMLPIVPVCLEANGRSIRTFAFLDQGSELTLVRADIAKDLFIDGPATTMTVETINGRAQQEFRKLPTLMIASRDGRSRFELHEAYSIDNLKISAKAKAPQQLQDAWPHLKGIELGPPNPRIGILVGADQPSTLEILEYRKDPANPRAPMGLLTHFGWCVSGPSSSVGARPSSCHWIKNLVPDEENDPFLNSIRSFVGIDQFGIDCKADLPLPPDVVRATDIFKKTTRLVDKHYEIGLPWMDEEPLPNNREAALRWFFSQETRLLKNPALAEKSRRAMLENVQLGFARKLTQEEEASGTPGRTWYNKYHPVINPNKPDKCRMVFDLSALFSGVSLNSKLLKGPDLLASQLGVTLRFRRYLFAIAADIEKMFYQVLVRPEDASVFRYLWREPGTKEPPAAYQMRVHLFGATSSPAVCCYALQQAAKDCGKHANIVFEEVVQNFYVDNWLASFKDQKECIRLAKWLIDALGRGGFNLTQFASSDPEILASIRKRARDLGDIDMSFDEDTTERTLGLVWNCFRDTFKLSVKPDLPRRVKTKRELLSVSSRIYDPLGFLAAVKLTPKLLFQETCRQKVHWDDPLDTKLADTWEKWVESLPTLTQLEVPRCLQPPGLAEFSLELHTFADASEYAHGAVSYLRFVANDRAKCSLIMAKSNLAPIRPSTIQRMELNGALAAARLSRTIAEELKMKIARAVFWTDSTTVLRWINSEHLKFKAYVGARIAEVLELTVPHQWHYVPTALNPADDASRGIAPSELTIDHRWFSGPEFLTLVPDQWPSSPINASEPEDDAEIRSPMNIFAAVVTSDRVDTLLESVSQLNRLIHVTAYVLRWFNAAKGTPRRPVTGQITV